MKKPFANAYEKIKELLRNIFSKKSKEPETPVEETPEEKKEESGTSETQKAEEKVEAKTETKTDKKAEKKPEPKQEKASEPKAEPKSGKKKEEPKKQKADSKKDDSKKIESVLQNIAEEEGIKEEKVSKAELDEQKKYEQEVKKRAERAAKREAKDRKAEKEEASGAGKKIIDPVTGEEIELGSLPVEATYLRKYTRIPTTSDDVVVAINSIIKHPDMPKNIVVLGRNGFGTVKVGEDFARSFYELGIVKSDKIAKTKAKQLNNMSLEKLSKLKGGCLIIENAGLVSQTKLVEVIKDSLPVNNDYVVILTGEIDSIAEFFEKNEDIVDSFIYLIDIHKIKERGMMHLAKGYVKERGYKAEKQVFDRFKNALKSMEEGNIDRFIKYIDEAIERCDKRESAKGGEAEKNILPEDVK
ncbi:MAG: hypothetical protein K6B68_07520 [Eubacterium sp.]|nr:hypothetical protein [Eubacterium sp.]